MHIALRSRTPLLYREGANPAIDRPAYVRSASGIAWLWDQLVLVQDDANFLAIVDPDSHETRSVTLPAGPLGKRQFDDVRGNKAAKFDFESCISLADETGVTVLGFGSGSKRPQRDHILSAHFESVAASPTIRLYPATQFYDGLRLNKAFSGSELNIEGVALGGDTLTLFQRGNGAPVGTLAAIDATATVSFPALRQWLASAGPVPQIGNVCARDLGVANGARLTFTDGLYFENVLYFLAAAEDSPDSLTDGPVAAVALGRIEGDHVEIWPLKNEADGWLTDKVEGLAMRRSASGELVAYVVVDKDDPHVPSELLVFQLTP